VIEDQGHPSPSPDLALSAELTFQPLESLVNQSPLQCRSPIGGVLYENRFQRQRLSTEPLNPRGIRFEVIGGDLPDVVDVPAKEPVVPANRSQAKPTKCFGV
jgi:hypothetical protein